MMDEKLSTQEEYLVIALRQSADAVSQTEGLDLRIAADTIDRQAKELAEARAEIERLKARMAAADRRLGDLKAKHTVWYQTPLANLTRDDDDELISEMENLAYSVQCYLEGVPGIYLDKVGEA